MLPKSPVQDSEILIQFRFGLGFSSTAKVYDILKLLVEVHESFCLVCFVYIRFFIFF